MFRKISAGMLFPFVIIALVPASAFTGQERNAAPNAVMAKADFPRVDDRGFLRRVWLDLTGRLPEPQHVEAFLADTRETKYAAEIDNLIESEAFIDRWTTFFEDVFQSHALIQEKAFYRNPFHQLIRNAVAENTPWNELAAKILTGSGNGLEPDTSMFFWIREAFEERFHLDYLDDQAAWISETMLGVDTKCISCHDGAGHLEQVNVGLSTMKREQFWGLSAFLSSGFLYIAFEDLPQDGEDRDGYYFLRKLQFVDVDQPGFNRFEGELILVGEEGRRGDRQLPRDGQYHATSEAGQGMRPPRNGGVIPPAYPFTGETPQPGETRRQALARILTSDRQFSRNMVNRVWAHFFGEGFVNPLNGWDMARLDEATAKANETTVQPRNAPLMEFLTDWFIQNGYDLRGLVRLIANSKLYQWDYLQVEPGQGAVSETDPWGYWRENQRVRRVDAETIVDNFFQLLGFQPKYFITGQPEQVYTSAWQLPEPAEPSEFALYERTDDEDGFRLSIDPQEFGLTLEEVFAYLEITRQFTNAFGRGDYFNGVARNTDNTIQNSLLLMNGFIANFWLEQVGVAPNVVRLSTALGQGQINHEELVRKLYGDMLFREPTSNELKAMTDHMTGLEPEHAVTDALWVLFNHPDYLFK